MPERCGFRKRRKNMCGGCAAGVFAYDVHLIQVCGWCKRVRLLSEGAMFWLWRWFVRFGYMAHPWADARKYGNYGGLG